MSLTSVLGDVILLYCMLLIVKNDIGHCDCWLKCCNCTVNVCFCN